MPGSSLRSTPPQSVKSGERISKGGSLALRPWVLRVMGRSGPGGSPGPSGARGPAAGQDAGIRLSRDDVAQDRDPRDPGDVADHVVELKVHEHQGLLHALDVGGGGLDELVAMPDQAAEGGHGRIGPEASAQEAKGVQLLDPLAVEDVGLASRNALDARPR